MNHLFLRLGPVGLAALMLCVALVSPYADAIDLRVERLGNTPAALPASDMQFVNATIGWIRTVDVGGTGQLWRTDDGGVTWREITSSGLGGTDQLWPSSGLIEFSFDTHKNGWTRTFDGL